MPTTILDNESYPEALQRRYAEEAKAEERMTTKLEQAARQLLDYWDLEDSGECADKYMAALREALAEQAEQEPVAYLSPNGKALHPNEVTAGEHSSGQFLAVYAAPVRTKDLTPYEITALIREGAAGGGWQGFAQRVIAADREKNK